MRRALVVSFCVCAAFLATGRRLHGDDNAVKQLKPAFRPLFAVSQRTQHSFRARRIHRF